MQTNTTLLNIYKANTSFRFKKCWFSIGEIKDLIADILLLILQSIITKSTDFINSVEPFDKI